MSAGDPPVTLEIGRRARPRPIAEIAEGMGLLPQWLEPYGASTPPR